MTNPIPEQVDYYLETMAFQKPEEVDTFDIEMLRSRLKGVILLAKMIKAGSDVFDLTGEDVAKSLKDYNAGRYYTFGKLGLVKNPDWPKEAKDENK